MNDDYSELRAKHYAVWVPKEQRGECDFCVTPYPCPTIRLLDEVERLRAEDNCDACPQSVRDFYATAHNFLGALKDYREGTDTESRLARKEASFRRSFERMEGLVAAHFEAGHHTRAALNSSPEVTG